jgi:tRNA G18 (ribose-2'-O)-methylase SpoU
MNRGFFGIGIQNVKTHMNIGTLWRSAHLLGASFIFTVGKRYTRQASDTSRADKHVPLYHYLSLEEFKQNIPHGCPVIGVELDDSAQDIQKFAHPDKCVYLLGAEDHGLTKAAVDMCHRLVVLPGDWSMNVATAGSIVMYDRWTKNESSNDY